MSRPDLSQLTERQREIYDFIKEKISSRGYGPTVREIGNAFRIKSPNGVMCHLKALEKKGIINRQGFSARAIQLVGYKPGAFTMPLVGQVAAGSPTQAIEQADQLELNDLFAGSANFALKVKGHSMIDDHIEDGDYVVIKPAQTARNGERVVAMVDGEATLKRFHKERNRIRLDPANSSMRPIYLDSNRDVRILGLLVGVLRKCRP
jgi:repressor LexA